MQKQGPRSGVVTISPARPRCGAFAQADNHRARILPALLLATAFALLSRSSFADEPKRFRWFGVQSDIGIPDGATLGIVVRPELPWLRFGASYSFNVVSSGIRGGFSLDPIDFPIAPTLSVEAGHVFSGEINGSWFGLDKNPQVEYNYLNLHLGVELGDRNRWRMFLRAGLSRIHLQTSDLASSGSETNLTINQASADATVFGTGKLGFVILF
jgi:hypothetical protein